MSSFKKIVEEKIKKFSDASGEMKLKKQLLIATFHNHKIKLWPLARFILSSTIKNNSKILTRLREIKDKEEIEVGKEFEIWVSNFEKNFMKFNNLWDTKDRLIKLKFGANSSLSGQYELELKGIVHHGIKGKKSPYVSKK